AARDEQVARRVAGDQRGELDVAIRGRRDARLVLAAEAGARAHLALDLDRERVDREPRGAADSGVPGAHLIALDRVERPERRGDVVRGAERRLEPEREARAAEIGGDRR